MKHLVYILTLVTLFGCGNSGKKDSSTISDRMEIAPEVDKDSKEEYEKSTANESEQTDFVNCPSKAIDFLKIMDQEVQADFLSKIDSTRKVQYPENDQETSIMVDLSPEYLNEFLSDIDSDTLRVNKRFEKDYHFNIAPKEFTDPKLCKDKIAVSFDEKDCSFQLIVHNTFLVEPDWCTESMVIYGFKMQEGKIFDFWRQEAG